LRIADEKGTKIKLFPRIKQFRFLPFLLILLICLIKGQSGPVIKGGLWLYTARGAKKSWERETEKVGVAGIRPRMAISESLLQSKVINELLSRSKNTANVCVCVGLLCTSAATCALPATHTHATDLSAPIFHRANLLYSPRVLFRNYFVINTTFACFSDPFEYFLPRATLTTPKQYFGAFKKFLAK